jgi:hypothetical protein
MRAVKAVVKVCIDFEHVPQPEQFVPELLLVYYLEPLSHYRMIMTEWSAKCTGINITTLHFRGQAMQI